MSYQLYCGDCREVLPALPDAMADCIISDPPYPEINRPYGRMTEAAWLDMMKEVVRQSRRILKPSGSAVFILQPNSERVGSMRLWLWEFIVWAGREWNLVQDAYWWNYTALPVGGAITGGLMRGSVKPCVWLGRPDCYRNQTNVLAEPSKSTRTLERNYTTSGKEVRLDSPSGRQVNHYRSNTAWKERGGVTPFNLLPIESESGSIKTSASAHGHGAGTPLKLADWWTRYLCPTGGLVLDPFSGVATMGIAALQNGCTFVGIERMRNYHQIARLRLNQWAKDNQLASADTL